MKQPLKLTLLVFVIGLLPLLVEAQTSIFVATTGDDSNAGTIAQPLKTLQGARDKVRTMIASGIPDGGIVVNFRGGRYPVTSSVSMGQQDSGEQGKPIVYTGYQDEKVIFDGTIFVDNSRFKISYNNAILHASAQGKVYVQKIFDANLIDILKNTTVSQMSMDDVMLSVARFPNIGFSQMNISSIDNRDEVIGRTNGGRLNGSIEEPRGAKFKILGDEDIDADKWSAEVERTKSVFIRGYISEDWFKEDLRLLSFSDNSAETVNDRKVFHPYDGSFYGVRRRNNHPNRFFTSHLLCELDQEGEWYFDVDTNELYIMPLGGKITEDSKIGVWAGPQLAVIDNASYIHFKRMTIQGLGDGTNGDAALNFRSGEGHLAAGITFRYISTPIVALNFLTDAKNSVAKSCDFFDIPNSTRLSGGRFSAGGVIENGNNTIENCHFTQIHSKDFAGKSCGISGVANIFKNNLIHNQNIQTITFSGIDHLIELNEIFNAGIEEGDGGSVYCGADVFSYGNVLKHNFLHHLMSIPTVLGRAALFTDDLDGGESMIENVSYKGGWEVLKMNGGAGHLIERNVTIAGHTGIRNGIAGSGPYASAMDYMNSVGGKTPRDNDKGNTFGRMLLRMGSPNWDQDVNANNWYDKIAPFWKQRYPRFDRVMKAYFDNKSMRPYEVELTDNLFSGSILTDAFYAGSSDVTETNSQRISLDIFENPDNLNFKFKEPRPSYAADIPFENIGLYDDEYRCATPNKDAYRRAIKERFEHLAVHTSDPYDYRTINQRVYFNTGKLLYSMVPCTGVFSLKDFNFDFGTANSALEPGYSRVSPNTTPGLFGWTDNTDVKTVDRNTGSSANRDLVFSSEAKTFEIVVPNGTYKVDVVMGDASAPHDNMIVKAEGNIKLPDVDTSANQFKENTFYAIVEDGKLSIEFSDGGGSDVNWVLTQMIVTPFGDGIQREFNFDLGTENNIVQLGYEGVTNTTASGFFGWQDTTGLDAIDRGTSTGANNVNRDFVYGSEAKVFEVNVPNGDYNVLLTFGDAAYPHDNIAVKAEGVQKLTGINTLPGNTFFNETFDVTITDGLLSLEFSDEGGNDPYWVVTRIVVKPASGSGKDLDKIIESDGNNEKTPKLYPNPVTGDILNIIIPNVDGVESQVVIFDITGKVVLSGRINKEHSQIDVSNINSGNYILNVVSGDTILRKRFFKN